MEQVSYCVVVWNYCGFPRGTTVVTFLYYSRSGRVIGSDEWAGGTEMVKRNFNFMTEC